MYLVFYSSAMEVMTVLSMAAATSSCLDWKPHYWIIPFMWYFTVACSMKSFRAMVE